MLVAPIAILARVMTAGPVVRLTILADAVTLALLLTPEVALLTMTALGVTRRIGQFFEELQVSCHHDFGGKGGGRKAGPFRGHVILKHAFSVLTGQENGSHMA